FTYGRSTFYLVFFHVSSGKLTKDIPPNKLKAALVVKNTSDKLMEEIPVGHEDHGAEPSLFREGCWYSSLQEIPPKTLGIAFEKEFNGTSPIRFDFIKKERERSLAGVRLSQEIIFDDLD